MPPTKRTSGERRLSSVGKSAASSSSSDDESAASRRRSTSGAPKKKRQRNSGKAKIAFNDGDAPAGGSSSSEEEDEDVQVEEVTMLGAAGDVVPGTNLRRGSIVAVRMSNFLTYSNCEVRPGQGMNVVIGPNGTGKSSLVSALAVAMGANLSVLDRSKAIGQFVLRGEASGYAEVELAGGYWPAHRAGGAPQQEVNLILKCEITKNNASKHKINGRAAKKSEVRQRVAQLNIHLDNLCQFLPQERVSAFASMKPEELLRETEKAAGPPEMFQAHEELVQMRDEHKRLASDVRKIRLSVQKLEDRQRPIRQDVARWQERKSRIEQANNMKLKRPWLLNEAQRRVTLEARTASVVAGQALEAFDKGLPAVFSEEKERLLTRLQRMERDIKLQADASIRVKRAHGAAQKKCDDLDEKEKEAEKDVVDKDDQIEKTKRDIKKAQAQIAQIESQLRRQGDDHAETSRIAAEVEALKIQHQELKERERPLKLAKAQTERELAQLRQRTNQKRRELETMRSPIERRIAQLQGGQHNNVRIAHAIRMIELVQQAKEAGQLQSEVLGPLCTQLTVQSEAAAQVVNFCLPLKHKLVFLPDNDADKQFLLDLMKRHDLQVGVTIPVARDAVRPAETDRAARANGIHCFVDDLFQAPPAVQHYLNNAMRLHLIGIGIEELKGDNPSRANALDNQDALGRAGLNSWLTGSIAQRTLQAVHTVHSRYTNEVNFNVSNVNFNGSSLIVASASSDEAHAESNKILRAELAELGQAFATIRGTLTSHEETIAAAEADSKHLTDQIRELSKQQGRRAALQGELDTNREKKEDSEKLLARLEREIEICREKLRAFIVRRRDAAIELCNAFVAMDTGSERSVRLTVQKAQIQASVSALDSVRSTFDAEKQQLEATYASLHETYKEHLRELKRLQDKANEVCPNPSDYREMFATFPDDVAALDDAIELEEQKAASLLRSMASNFGDVDERMVERQIQEFEDNQVKLERLQAQCEADLEKLKALTHGIRKKRLSWVRSVVEMISQVSTHFSAYFEAMHCAGEVGVRSGDGRPITQETIARLEADVAEDLDKDLIALDHDDANDEDGELDFANYAAELRVSFRRDTQLEVLSAQRQSGGEKSVSTMLYLISLQQLSKSPFRLVDEINQGMDAHNERMVFELLSRAARGQLGSQAVAKASAGSATGPVPAGLPQYFLITPKLLENLPFEDGMTVLCVFNGPWMMESAHWKNCYNRLLESSEGP